MRVNKLLYLLLAFIIEGCSKSPSLHFDSEQLNNVPQTKVTSIVIKEDLVYNYPVKIAKCDSLFLIQDLMNKGYVYLLDSKGESIECLVKKGKGHTEISNAPSDIFFDKKRDVVSLYSAPYYVEYNIRDFINNKPNFCSKVNCSEIVSYPVKNARKLANGYLLAGFTDEMRFAVVENDSSIISKEYPPILPENKNADIAAVLTYDCDVVVSPNKSRWVQTSYIGAILDIFEYDGKSIKCVRTNPIYKPMYVGGKHDVSWNEETIIGFDDMVVTDKYIYTLLNGTKGENLKSNPPVNPFTDKITVFDWNGNIKEIINTDCMMMAIDIDEKENMCYAISFNFNHGYDLRKIPLPIAQDTK